MQARTFYQLQIIISLITLINISSTNAQTLPRKATLGIGVLTLNDSIAKLRGLSINKGVVVTTVLPNTTGSALGILVDDIITQIDKQVITDRSQVFQLAANLNEGDKLVVNLRRRNKSITLQGVVSGKPGETSPSGEVIYGAVQTSLGLLRTIIHKPTGSGKKPAILFLQGIYCGSQDFWFQQSEPTKLLIDDWVKAGYVVYRFERPGIGDSQGTKTCRDLDFNDELLISKEAYQHLLSLAYVDTDSVFLFGHSMGSIVAPLLAPQHQPKGVIVYAPIFKSWFEYFIDNFREQPIYFGVETQLQMDEMVRNSIPLLYQWLVQGKSPDEIRSNPENKTILENPRNAFNNYSNGDYFFSRLHRFFSSMNSVSNSQAWSKVNCKVLAIYGTSDLEGLSDRPARDIVLQLNQQSEGSATFLSIKNADHSFANVNSKEQGAELRVTNKYAPYVRGNYHPDIAKETINWMKQLK